MIFCSNDPRSRVYVLGGSSRVRALRGKMVESRLSSFPVPSDPSLSVVGIRVEGTTDAVCPDEGDSSPDREAVVRCSPSLSPPPKAVRFNLNRVSPADADHPLLQAPEKEPPPKFRSPEVMPATTSTTESGAYLPVKQLKEYRRKCDVEESTGTTSHGGADDCKES